jgi:6-phospho-beta-glucosidase
MPAIRLCIVGGGSAYMTSMFSSLGHFAAQGGLAGSEIVLYDTDAGNARLMGDWGRAVAKHHGIPLTFEETSNLDEALRGADFVLSTFRTGGLAHRFLDETTPLKYGELGQETTGVGGIFMALRCVPEVVRLSQAIQKNCPNAWLINYTNPTSFVCDASIRAGHSKTIGLCDGVYGIKWLGAKLLGLPIARARDVEAYVAGLNHCTWTTQLYFEGRDLYREMDALTADLDLSGTGEAICDGPLNAVECDAVRLYRYYGLLPGSIYYTRYYYTLKQVLKKFSDPKFQHRSQWLAQRAAAKRENIRQQLTSGQASFAAFDEEDASHGDQAIGAIHAIANDTREVETANVVNNGAVPNLPNDAIVEVTCTLGRYGAMPAAAGPLPRSVQGIIRMVHDHAVLTVDAAMSGDRKLVLQAAMAHPCHRDFHVMEEVVEEMFRVHKQWLPQF